jgi:hypothetical protein
MEVGNLVIHRDEDSIRTQGVIAKSKGKKWFVVWWRDGIISSEHVDDLKRLEKILDKPSDFEITVVEIMAKEPT